MKKNYKKTHCLICNREFRNCNYKKHNCSKNLKFKILEEWKIGENLYKCSKCECSFSKMGLVSHYYRKHDERGIQYLEKRKNYSKKHNKKRLTKEEISKVYSNSMKIAYQNGNAKGWDFINKDKNRRSYPEKFFIKVFHNNNLYEKYKIEEKFSYGKYFIDFLFTDIKLIVEIDGSQHYRTSKAIEHDRIRDEYFISEGFKIYRIKWNDVYKNAQLEIDEFLNFISNIESNTIRRYSTPECVSKKEQLSKVCQCGSLMNKKSKMCINCKRLKERKIKDRPDLETLLYDIKILGYCGTGRKYGVSDNCIRKWIKSSRIGTVFETVVP